LRRAVPDRRSEVCRRRWLL
ncbi:hypothetical protein AZ037_001976, partial [Klebsiella michiganensis]